MKLLEDPASSDIRERVANNNLALEEAITLLRKRHQEEVARMEAEAASRAIGRKQFQNIAYFFSHFESSDTQMMVDLFNPAEGEDLISDLSKRPLGKDELLKVAQILTNIANAS
jgi:hypothetical protein